MVGWAVVIDEVLEQAETSAARAAATSRKSNLLFKIPPALETYVDQRTLFDDLCRESSPSTVTRLGFQARDLPARQPGVRPLRWRGAASCAPAPAGRSGGSRARRQPRRRESAGARSSGRRRE